jgi:hypothetical protein
MKIKVIAMCMMLALLAIGSTAQATTTTMPFSEDFESSTVPLLPTGWVSNITDAGNSYAPAWTVVNEFFYPEISPYRGSQSVMFNSWETNCGIARLEYSSLFDFTGYNSLEMSFAMSHDNGCNDIEVYYADDRVQWQYKLLGGEWTSIGDAKHRIQAEDASWGIETVDFSEVAGQTDVQIGLLGISEYGNNIFIDNISLTGTSPAAVPEPATLLGFGLPILMVGLGKLRQLRK